MRKTTKAMLFSALLCPGSGHFLFKKSVAGAFLVVVTLLAGWRLFSITWERAQTIVDKILSGDIAPNVEAMTAALEKLPPDATANYMSIILLTCWVVGIIDVYRIGHWQNKSTRLQNKN